MSKHEIVIGMALGDEGKGATTSYLSSKTPTDFVVRASGGSQNAHNVIEQGVHHTFAQFGSGTLHHVPTITSRFCMVNPLNLLNEAFALSNKVGYDVLHNHAISVEAKVLTVLHRTVNQLREEARGQERHGSCGQGIGELMWFTTENLHLEPLKMKHLGSLSQVIQHLNEYLEWATQFFTFSRIMDRMNQEFGHKSVLDVAQELVQIFNDHPFMLIEEDNVARMIAASNHVVFEGSQGVLLDEWMGFHPHTTWSTTTHANAYALMSEAGLNPAADSTKVGVIRTYFTRHGFGPFPTELATPEEKIAYPELHNAFGQWQGDWRIGHFDLPLFRYALAVVGGVDNLAVTHCDIPAARTVVDYQAPLPVIHDLDVERQENQVTNVLKRLDKNLLYASHMDLDTLLTTIEQAAGTRIGIKSYGAALEDRVEIK